MRGICLETKEKQQAVGVLAPTVRDGTEFRGKVANGPSSVRKTLRRQHQAGRDGVGAGESRRKWCYFNWIPEESKGHISGSPLDTDSTYVRIPPGPHLPRNP